MTNSDYSDKTKSVYAIPALSIPVAYKQPGDKHTDGKLEVRAGELENHRFLLAVKP